MQDYWTAHYFWRTWMPELHQQPFVLVVNTVAHGAAHAYVAKQITLYNPDSLGARACVCFQSLRLRLFKINHQHLLLQCSSMCRYENGNRDQKVTKEVMLSFERVRLSIRCARVMWQVALSNLNPFQRAV
jgi:hypothetical protein